MLVLTCRRGAVFLVKLGLAKHTPPNPHAPATSRESVIHLSIHSLTHSFERCQSRSVQDLSGLLGKTRLAHNDCHAAKCWVSILTRRVQLQSLTCRLFCSEQLQTTESHAQMQQAGHCMRGGRGAASHQRVQRKSRSGKQGRQAQYRGPAAIQGELW